MLENGLLKNLHSLSHREYKILRYEACRIIQIIEKERQVKVGLYFINFTECKIDISVLNRSEMQAHIKTFCVNVYFYSSGCKPSSRQIHDSQEGRHCTLQYY